MKSFREYISEATSQKDIEDYKNGKAHPAFVQGVKNAANFPGRSPLAHRNIENLPKEHHSIYLNGWHTQRDHNLEPEQHYT